MFTPSLTVGGIPGGPYTLTPTGAGTITIESLSTQGAGTLYLTGTLGIGDLSPVGSQGPAYGNFQADITGISITNNGGLGSNALAAIDNAGLPLDFTLVLQGATGGFRTMLEGGGTGSDSFSGDMTIIPEPTTLLLLALVR